MNIGALQIGFGLEVPNTISLNIYISGCYNNKKCAMRACHNQQLRDFSFGVDYMHALSSIHTLATTQLIDCIVILGGEPLDADKEKLLHLITVLTQYNKSIYIYTGYELEDIKQYVNILFTFGVCGICYGHYNNNGNTHKQWLYNTTHLKK